MSRAQKNAFVQNRVVLVKTVTPSVELLAFLRVDNHITGSMEEEIMVCVVHK